MAGEEMNERAKDVWLNLGEYFSGITLEAPLIEQQHDVGRSVSARVISLVKMYMRTLLRDNPELWKETAQKTLDKLEERMNKQKERCNVPSVNVYG